MKTLIIVYSYHHNNTLKVAKAIADVLDADIKSNIQVKNIELKEYDLIGFGSGIDSGMHYKQLLDFANTISLNNNSKKCFVFSTSAMQNEQKIARDHSKLKGILEEKGYNIIGEFSCKGFNTNSFLKYIGGINKEHPNNNDIDNAKKFATELLNKI